MNKRFYLDYNASAPLAKSFAMALWEGKVPDANASSIHRSGRNVAKRIAEVNSYLYRLFNLSEKEYEILFHSGASEAAATFLDLGADVLLVYFETDHACALEQVRKHKENGGRALAIEVQSDGSIDLERAVMQINQKAEGAAKVLLHFTWMNNETGVVFDLSIAESIKEKTGCLVYVDAVQSVGKVSHFLQLNSKLDVFTYSGHKFGALRGIGFSFYKRSFDLKPLIRGGGQQRGIRSGTLNSQGIVSLEYALIETVAEYSKSKELETFKSEIESLLSENENIHLFGNKSNNTICFVHKKLKADVMLIHFDLAGLDVSSGSACSSGSVEPSRVIKAMGYEELALNSIRISLGFSNLSNKEAILDRLTLVMSKL